MGLVRQQFVSAAVNISSCTTLSDAGETYTLTADINGGGSSCLIIQANNVVIEGNGHSITSSTYAIDARGSSDGASGYNFTLRNAVVSGDVSADGAAATTPSGNGGNGGNIILQYVLFVNAVSDDISSVGGNGAAGSTGATGSAGTSANGGDGMVGLDGTGANGSDGGAGGTGGAGGAGMEGGIGGVGGDGGDVTLNSVRNFNSVDVRGGEGGPGGNGGAGGEGGSSNGGNGGNGGTGVSFGMGVGDGGPGGNGGNGGNGGTGGVGGNGGSGGSGGNGGDAGVFSANDITDTTTMITGGGGGAFGPGGIGGAGGLANAGTGGTGGLGGQAGDEGGAPGSQGTDGALGTAGTIGTAGSSGNDGGGSFPGSDGSESILNPAPTPASARVNGSTLILTISEFIVDQDPTPSSFTVTVDGSPVVVNATNVIGLGHQIQMTLNSAVSIGQTVLISYNPGSVPVTDLGTSPQNMNSFSDFSVTNNSTTDLLSPSVSITDPTNGSMISDFITISATASDNVGVVGVSFYYDNHLIDSEDIVFPYAVPFDTTDGIPDGNYTLYAVARDAVGNRATSTISVTINNLIPIISSLATSSLTSTGVTVTWNTTGVPSDSLVEYGLTSSYTASSTYDATLVTSHSRSLTGLTPNTTYHYRVVSVDAQGSRTNGSDQTFTTSVGSDTTPPVISSVVASSTSATTLRITWTTNEAATSTVEYGLTSGYGTASSSATATTSHSIVITGLTGSTTYHFRILNWDSAGNLATTTDATITTSAAPDVTAPIISSIATSTTSTTATIGWSTNENASSTVLYGLTTSYGSASSSVTLTTSPTISLTGLSAATTYYFKILSSDASNNVSSSTGSFVTAAADTTAPSYVSSSATGNTVTLTYDDTLDASSIPSTSAFSVLVAGSPVSITGVQVTGNTVVLTLLSNPNYIVFGQSVVLSYTPGGSPIQDSVGNTSSALSSITITNTSTDPNTGGGSSNGSGGGWSTPTGGSGGSSGGSFSYTNSTATANTSSTTTTPKIIIPLTNTNKVCTPYITSNTQIKLGVRNNTEVVKSIQTYLNLYEGNTLVVDGVYKQADVDAVKIFQTKYKTQILSPWGFSAPTGIVFTTTIAKMNAVVCGENLGCPVFTEKTNVKSNHEEVPHIKNFLNQVVGTKLNTNSTLMDLATIRAISAFQTRYKEYVLKPLGLTRATGLWYESTMKQANGFMGCVAR